VVTCVYVNPETDQFWIIDYRIYDPAGDGKTKLDHVAEMLRNCVHQTDYVVTNKIAQDNVEVVQDVCGFRWKVEQFHRETKQLTGLESCQCRRARIVRNHIGCAILVWGRLKQVA
jgi:hypothetical protein